MQQIREAGIPRSRSDGTDTLVVAQQRAVWELVKEYIEEQIVLDIYPIGSWLPSVRDLSAQIGLNRNTISKAYRALGRDGTVVAKHGVGVLVARRPIIDRHPTERLSSLIVAVVEEAKRSGVTADMLLKHIETELARVSRVQQVQVAFIECSPQDTEKMSQHLSRHLEVSVTPLDLNDFLNNTALYAQTFDILSTTFFHLQEVTAAASQHDSEIVGLHHVPSHESILELARLPSSLTIGVICINVRTLEKVSSVIRMYSRCGIVSCVVDDEEALQKVISQADVLVDTVRAHEVVASRDNALPFITLDFQTEPQSIEYLQNRIRSFIAGTPSTGVRAPELHE